MMVVLVVRPTADRSISGITLAMTKVMSAISRKRPLERVSSSSRALLPPEWLALTTKPMTAVRASRSLVLFMIAAATSAHAGQPLVTDDAAVVAPKTCQLETWTHWVR